MIELPRHFLGMTKQELQFVEGLLNAPKGEASRRDLRARITQSEALKILDVVACRARQKIGAAFDAPGRDFITTVWGRGYRLADGARDLILQAAGFEVREAA